MLLRVHDLFEGALLVRALERRVSADELVHKHAERPVVDALVVSLGQNQLPDEDTQQSRPAHGVIQDKREDEVGGGGGREREKSNI